MLSKYRENRRESTKVLSPRYVGRTAESGVALGRTTRHRASSFENKWPCALKVKPYQSQHHNRTRHHHHFSQTLPKACFRGCLWRNHHHQHRRQHRHSQYYVFENPSEGILSRMSLAERLFLNKIIAKQMISWAILGVLQERPKKYVEQPLLHHLIFGGCLKRNHHFRRSEGFASDFNYSIFRGCLRRNAHF